MASALMYRGCENKSIKTTDFVLYWSGVAVTKDPPGRVSIQEVNDTNIKQRHRGMKDTNT